MYLDKWKRHFWDVKSLAHFKFYIFILLSMIILLVLIFWLVNELFRILIQLKMAIKYLILRFRLNKNMLLKRFTCLHFLQSSFMVDIIVCVRTRWDEDKNAVLNMQYSRLKVRLNRGICLVSILEVHKTQNIYFESF